MERPVAAAIKIQNRIFTGLLHCFAWEEAEAELGFRNVTPGWVEGFVTDLGRFVDRLEAAELLDVRGALCAEDILSPLEVADLMLD